MVLEFLPIFTIATLHDAVAVVQEANRPNGGVLVDTLHLARSGGGVEDLATVPRSLIPYLQLADATAPPRRPDARRTSARRRCTGGCCRARAHCRWRRRWPPSRTCPSRSSCAPARSWSATPDPTERAQAVLTATRAVLAQAVR